jgi:hypothetical protein
MYGLLGKDSSNSTVLHRPSSDPAVSNTNITTFSPSLNVSAHFAATRAVATSPWNAPWSVYPSGHLWRDPDNADPAINQPFVNPSPLFYDADSTTLYNASQFDGAASCQQQGEVKCKWGFSFLPLYTYILALLLWSIGMWGLYLHVWLHMHPLLEKRELGLERAALDIAAALESRTRGQILSDDESGKGTSATAVDTTGNAQLCALGKDVSLSLICISRKAIIPRTCPISIQRHLPINPPGTTNARRPPQALVPRPLRPRLVPCRKDLALLPRPLHHRLHPLLHGSLRRVHLVCSLLLPAWLGGVGGVDRGTGDAKSLDGHGAIRGRVGCRRGVVADFIFFGGIAA